MYMKIYTDGACSGNPGGPGGWAAVFSHHLLETKILKGRCKETTNNRMELLAVIKAVEKIKTIKSIDDFVIYSDSAYVVNAVNNHWITKWMLSDWKTTKGDMVKNEDLWKRLYEAIKEVRIQDKVLLFKKVKGHSGNPLNEYADELAKSEVEKMKMEIKNECC